MPCAIASWKASPRPGRRSGRRHASGGIPGKARRKSCHPAVQGPLDFRKMRSDASNQSRGREVPVQSTGLARSEAPPTSRHEGPVRRPAWPGASSPALMCTPPHVSCAVCPRSRKPAPSLLVNRDPGAGVAAGTRGAGPPGKARRKPWYPAVQGPLDFRRMRYHAKASRRPSTGGTQN